MICYNGMYASSGSKTCFGCAQDKCPRIMNQHPPRVGYRPLVHDGAPVLGVWIAKHSSATDVACKPFMVYSATGIIVVWV